MIKRQAIVDAATALVSLWEEIKRAGMPPHTDYWDQSLHDKRTALISAVHMPDVDAKSEDSQLDFILWMIRDEVNEGHDVFLEKESARLLWSYIDRLTGRCAALAALRYGEPRSAGIPTPASTCDVMPATMEGLHGPRCQCGKYEWLPDTRSIRDGAGVYHWHDASCSREISECICPVHGIRHGGSKIDGGF